MRERFAEWSMSATPPLRVAAVLALWRKTCGRFCWPAIRRCPWR